MPPAKKPSLAADKVASSSSSQLSGRTSKRGASGAKSSHRSSATSQRGGSGSQRSVKKTKSPSTKLDASAPVMATVAEEGGGDGPSPPSVAAEAIQTAQELRVEQEATLAAMTALGARLSASENKHTLERQLGQVLSELEQKSASDLIRMWDQNGDMEVSRTEFRLVLRSKLSLKASNVEINELFDKFDIDSGGSLDAQELKNTIKTLADATRDEHAQGIADRKKVEAMKARTGLLAKCIESAKQAEAMVLKLDEFMHTPPLDARLGRVLVANMNGGTTLDEIAARWQEQAGERASSTAEEGSGEAGSVGTRLGRAAFQQLIRRYKNIGDLRIDGSSTEIGDQIDRLFDALMSSLGGSTAVGEELTVAIRQSLEMVTAAAASQDEQTSKLAQEVAAVRAEAASAQQALVAFDAETKAVEEAAVAEVRRAAEEAKEAKGEARLRAQKEKTAAAAAGAAAAEAKGQRMEDVRDKLRRDLEKQKRAQALARGEKVSTRDLMSGVSTIPPASVTPRGTSSGPEAPRRGSTIIDPRAFPAYMQQNRAASAPTESKTSSVAGLWRTLVGATLSSMASSLEGALEDETNAKLRELFDKLDLDGGGTLTIDELQKAIEASGKKISDEKLAMMMKAADHECALTAGPVLCTQCTRPRTRVCMCVPVLQRGSRLVHPLVCARRC